MAAPRHSKLRQIEYGIQYDGDDIFGIYGWVTAGWSFCFREPITFKQLAPPCFALDGHVLERVHGLPNYASLEATTCDIF